MRDVGDAWGRPKMKLRTWRLAAGIVGAGAMIYAAIASASAAEVNSAPLMVSFKELKWTALPERAGMEFAILSGDPKVGQYTQMRKVPAGIDNPLHAHSSELTNVIISGVWYTGTDMASAKDFGPGSVVRMPANWVHVSGCRFGSECVFYQDGKGRFDFKPVSTPGK
jgi:quercetin dioxygenase-like cupin family protein